jgi:Phytanoyl-CoA dioxygenase (PhyH)
VAGVDLVIVPSGELGNEVGPGSTDGPSLFNRDGYVVGRSALPRDLILDMRKAVLERLGRFGQLRETDDSAEVVRANAGWSAPAGEQATALMMAEKEALDGFADPVLASGLLEAALERLWGRPPLVHRSAMVTMSIPGEDRYGTSPHRDIGAGGPDRVRLWVPLVRLDPLGGGLALAVGSHEIEELPESDGSPFVHPRTGEPVGLNPADFGDTWRVTHFEIGDVLLFRPDIVHASVVNRTKFVRLAVPFFATDGRLPEPPGARLSNLQLSLRTLQTGPEFSTIMQRLGASSQEIRMLMTTVEDEVPSETECRELLRELRASRT